MEGKLDGLLCSCNARSQEDPRWTRAVGDHLARPQGRNIIKRWSHDVRSGDYNREGIIFISLPGAAQRQFAIRGRGVGLQQIERLLIVEPSYCDTRLILCRRLQRQD